MEAGKLTYGRNNVPKTDGLRSAQVNCRQRKCRRRKGLPWQAHRRVKHSVPRLKKKSTAAQLSCRGWVKCVGTKNSSPQNLATWELFKCDV